MGGKNDAYPLGDLLVAVAVCAQSHMEAIEFLDNEKEADKFLRYWAKKCRRMDFVAEAAKLVDYFKFYQTFPLSEAHFTGAAKTPIEWRMAAQMMSEFNCSWDEALATPFARAVALWAANGDRTGRLRLVDYSDDNQSFVDRVWEHQRKKDLARLEQQKN